MNVGKDARHVPLRRSAVGGGGGQERDPGAGGRGRRERRRPSEAWGVQHPIDSGIGHQ
jgi:hypothetical protein